MSVPPYECQLNLVCAFSAMSSCASYGLLFQLDEEIVTDCLAREEVPRVRTYRVHAQVRVRVYKCSRLHTTTQDFDRHVHVRVCAYWYV